MDTQGGKNADKARVVPLQREILEIIKRNTGNQQEKYCTIVNTRREARTVIKTLRCPTAGWLGLAEIRPAPA